MSGKACKLKQYLMCSFMLLNYVSLCLFKRAAAVVALSMDQVRQRSDTRYFCKRHVVKRLSVRIVNSRHVLLQKNPWGYGGSFFMVRGYRWSVWRTMQFSLWLVYFRFNKLVRLVLCICWCEKHSLQWTSLGNTSPKLWKILTLLVA